MTGRKWRKRHRGGGSLPSDAAASDCPRRTIVGPAGAARYWDLYVPVPRSDVEVAARLLLEHFRSAGFSHVAWTHTVYGPPRWEDDAAHRVFGGVRGASSSAASPPQVLFRLHAVLENASDIAHYARPNAEDATGATKRAPPTGLDDYHVVSVAPRTEAAFQAACSSPSRVQIITLDYAATSRGVLPFQIGRSDVKAAVAQKIAFEVPMAAACLNRNLRKGLVQTCRMLQSACLGLKPRIIVSSGPRLVGEEDAGTLALRMPGDLINVVHTVLGWDTKSAIDALSSNARLTVDQGRFRRSGQLLVVDVTTEIAGKRTLDNETGSDAYVHKETRKPDTGIDEQVRPTGSDQADLDGDGFISFQ